MEPTNNSTNGYVSCALPITEKMISSLFERKQYLVYKSELNNGRYSAEKIAEVFQKVIESKVPLLVNQKDVYAIRYKMDELKYNINSQEVYLDYDFFIDMFKDLTNIHLVISKDKEYIEGIVCQKSPLFVSDLQFPTNLESHFLSLFQNKLYTDVVFELRDGFLLQAHKAVLSQCPYFDRMFRGALKESGTTTPIKLDIDPEPLICLVEYLYTHNLENCSFPFYIALLTVADFVQYDPLKSTIFNRITRTIDKNNFIHLATVEEPNLEALFQRCLLNYYNDSEVNLSDYSLASIVMLCLKAKSYGRTGILYQSALNEIPKKLELNQEFIYICKEITKCEDRDAKEVWVKAIKENKELYRKLRKGRNGEYKEHWEFFSKFVADLAKDDVRVMVSNGFV